MFNVDDSSPVNYPENDDFEVKSENFESPKNLSGGSRDRQKTIVKQKIPGEEDDEEKKDLNFLFDTSNINDISNI